MIRKLSKLVDNNVYIESCYVKNLDQVGDYIEVDNLKLVSVPITEIVGRGIDYFISTDASIDLSDQDQAYLNIIEKFYNDDKSNFMYVVKRYSVHNLIRKIKVWRTMRNHSAFVVGLFSAIFISLLFAMDIAGNMIALWVILGVGISVEIYLLADFIRNHRRYKNNIKDLSNDVKANYPLEQQRAIMTIAKN